MVSSRSKTAAEAAANRRTTRSKSGGVGLTTLPSPDSKPVTSKSPRASKKPPSKAASTTKVKGNVQKKDGAFCICKGSDDGTPMIKCEGGCMNWYHFSCINLSEDDAGEIEKYICTGCEAKTGLKTIRKLDYEGVGAMVEDVAHTEAAKSLARKKIPILKEEVVDKEDVESVEETADEGSDDDFVVEPESKKARAGKRVTRRLSFSDKSESDSDASGDDSTSRRKGAGRGPARAKRVKKNAASKSPAPESSATAIKRRGSSTQQHASKRSRTSEAPESANDDPVRKYCISKLEEIIKPMFIEYPGAPEGGVEEGKEDGEEKSPKKAEGLTDEEKENINQRVSQFVAELERCMMDTYAEPDKTGKPSAGGKYKERFRMLAFNLPKQDRVQLRQGIAFGRIKPAQLNIMSSTDLADEHLKHEIEVAEKEALEHSILQKITAPRAKITHKGFETIEDFSGQQRTADALKEEEEERRMEMEKREREKLSRLRQLSLSEGGPSTPVEPSPLSASLPPNSPTQARSASWGAPPPLPARVPQTQDENAPIPSPVSATRPPTRPLFIPSGSDYMSSMEDGLNLSDLINLDDDDSSAEPIPPALTSTSIVSDASTTISTPPELAVPSGPSPFTTAKPQEDERRASFDLSALWIGSENKAEEQVEEKTEQREDSDMKRAESPEEMADEAMEIDSMDDNDDLALDAILQQSGTTPRPANLNITTEDKPEGIEGLPQVWTGEITMPLDANTNLTPKVITRQIGGRELEPLSGYWQTLFPHLQARIDGRVPTDTSTNYLVTTRMNPTKELIAVCFTPSTDEDKAMFDELISFLLQKDRHALVFPWGVHPSPHAPGRELYIVPLLQDNPVPEFIELLDNHHLPKERKSSILIGVFILNKGKLAASTPPPPPVVPTLPTTTVASQLPPSSYPPNPSVASMAVTPVNHPGLANVPVLPTLTTPPIGSIPPRVDPNSLSAEIASLTPDQVQLLLQHLSQSSQVPPVIPSPPVIAPASVPLGQGPQPAYGMPPFPPSFPPYQQSPPHPPPNVYESGPYPGAYENENEYQARPYGREERGNHGRGRGSERGRRGRGRGKQFVDKNSGRQRDANSSQANPAWVAKTHGQGFTGSPPHERRTRFGD